MNEKDWNTGDSKTPGEVGDCVSSKGLCREAAIRISEEDALEIERRDSGLQ